MRRPTISKKATLEQIIVLSYIAIDRLYTITYYENIMAARDDINKGHFEELLRYEIECFNELNERIHELNETLIF